MIPANKLKVKVCGMRVPGNIKELAALTPEFMGFIFYEGSARNAEGMPVTATSEVPQQIQKTGVFVNATLEFVREKIEKYDLQAIQLHGQEDEAYCAALKATETVKIIKAFGLVDDFNFEVLIPFDAVTDYFLFDTFTPAHGGSGKTFNWEILKQYKGSKPYFLSGGIGIEHAAVIAALEDERLFAIDINSRFEQAPGIKDVEKIRLFLEKLNTHQ